MIDTWRAADVYLEMVRQRSSVGQSGRFISARSLVRVQSLPPSERPPSECGAWRAVGNSRVRRSRGVGRLAQWLERLLHTQEVRGSTPRPPTRPPVLNMEWANERKMPKWRNW